MELNERCRLNMKNRYHQSTARLLRVSLLLLTLLTTPLAVASGLTDSSPLPEDSASPLELTPRERSWLLQHPPLHLGIDTAWMPFEYVDSAGRHRGISFDLVEKLRGMLGIEMTVVSDLSWSEVVEGVKKRELDLLPALTKTEERAIYPFHQALFSNHHCPGEP
mgnify:CR=1 FL=1